MANTGLMILDGIELVEGDADPELEVSICQADPDGPEFRCLVSIPPNEEYSAIYQKAQREKETRGIAGVGGFRAKEAEDEVKQIDAVAEREYTDKILKGWHGLTIKNWEALNASRLRLNGTPEAIAAARAKNVEIPFSPKLAFILHKSANPIKFRNVIFNAIMNGHAVVARREADAKKPSES